LGKYIVQLDGRFVNITERQADLLRVLVTQHETTGGAEFIFTQSFNGAGICYPNGPSLSVTSDASDILQLGRERLVTLANVGKPLRGKPTELGIALVRSGFELASGVPGTVTSYLRLHRRLPSQYYVNQQCWRIVKQRSVGTAFSSNTVLRRNSRPWGILRGTLVLALLLSEEWCGANENGMQKTSWMHFWSFSVSLATTGNLPVGSARTSRSPTLNH
jgi:hypothetical protein